MRLSAAFCRADGCGAPALSLAGLPGDPGVQLLAGFLVPDGATAPADATAEVRGEGAVALVRDGGLEAALQADRPAAAGERWVGYASGVLGAAGALTAPGDWAASADVAFGRGGGGTGLPVPEGFEHAAMGGVRVATRQGTALPPGRPVDCAELRPLPAGVPGGPWMAGLAHDGAGRPLVPTTLCGPTSAGGVLALADLEGAGAVAAAPAGATATVPFTLRYVGAPGPAFALSASTEVPDGTAAPAQATLAPARAGFEDVPVRVAIPAGTAPGDYAVVLRAQTGGEVRRATGTVTVQAGPATGAATASGVTEEDAGPVAAAGAQAAGAVDRARLLELRAVGRAAPGRRGIVVLGELRCHELAGWCGPALVQLAVPARELRLGARAPAVRGLVTIGRTLVWVPALGRSRLVLAVGRDVRRLVARGAVLHAVLAVHTDGGAEPIVRHVVLARR